MAVTALPVLARFLEEWPLPTPWIGAHALVCSAISDVLAWCGLLAAFLLADVQDANPLAAVIAIIGLVLAPLAGTAARRHRHRPGCLPAAVLIAGLPLAAAGTSAGGLHPLIGAFAYGISVSPLLGARRVGLGRRLRPAVRLLLPMYFASVGSSVDVQALTVDGWRLFAVVLATAFVSKLAAGALAGRVARLSHFDAAVLGILLNARGLTEIVLADIGRQAGLIPPELFTALVLTAVATTLLTGPLLSCLTTGAQRLQQRD
jgi:Kef-type K+ transport system membrane component KefB